MLGLSSRVRNVSESVTLKLNEKAQLLQKEGKVIYNLTAGQLPFRPHSAFIQAIENQLIFLKSFQYAPVSGVGELKKKCIKYIEDSREISLDGFECAISNGAKHSLYNILGTIINPGDEVVLFSPYWVSYPEMIKFWGGVPVSISSQSHNAFLPLLDDLKRVLSPRTKAIIINAPNNPAGIHYPKSWMKEFAEIMLEHPETLIISDEIYYELCYFDPSPTYYYQLKSELLKQTVIVDGISKSFAATGLRIGYCIGPSHLIKGLTKIQGQTTSGANALIQWALTEIDFESVKEYLRPIKLHLRENADVLREAFRKSNLSHSWYQSTSAFYYLLDFSSFPRFLDYKENDQFNNEEGDFSEQICTDILEDIGVAIIPSKDFGIPNSARISLVSEKGPFEEAMTMLFAYLGKRES